MGWYQMPDGTRRHAQPNTRRARELAALGASPCDTPTPDTEPDEPEATPGEEPIEVVLSQPAKDVVAHASTVDQEASRFAAECKVPRWRALASVVFMNRRKVRNAA